MLINGVVDSSHDKGVERIVVHLIAPSEEKVKFLEKTPSEEKIIVHEREV
jgi:hypothetical protein